MLARCPTWVGLAVLLIAVVSVPLGVAAVRHFRRQAAGEGGLGLLSGMAARAGMATAAMALVGVLGVGLLLGWPRWVLGTLGAAVGVLLLAMAISSLRTIRRLDQAARVMLETARHSRLEGEEGGSPWRSS